MLAVGDRVLVRPDPPKVKLGKVMLAPSAQRWPNTGEVIDVGPDVDGLEAGMRIAYAGRVGVEVDVNETMYLILPYSACLAVLP